MPGLSLLVICSRPLFFVWRFTRILVFNFRTVVRGGTGVGRFRTSGIWGFRREDRKRNRQSITISTLRFENLTTALKCRFIPQKLCKSKVLIKWKVTFKAHLAMRRWNVSLQFHKYPSPYGSFLFWAFPWVGHRNFSTLVGNQCMETQSAPKDNEKLG